MEKEAEAYDAAVKLMNGAKRAWEFKKAAGIFSTIPSFKDSDAKKEICMKHAEECAREETYNSAIEKIFQGKKITLLNWRKYQ